MYKLDKCANIIRNIDKRISHEEFIKRLNEKNLLEDYEYTINYHSSIKNKITILDENIKKTQNSKWKKKVRTDKYLFCVKAMSKVFRAKFVALLRASGIKDQDLMDKLFTKNWVVYAKRPFGGPKQVIEYLGRYTHKVAISNHRIKEVTDHEVRFGYKDYRKEGQKKEMTLSNTEFVRRFSLHILPRRFVRIRHYGILSSSWKRGKLQDLQSDLKIQITEVKPKTLLKKCRCCKEGNLITIALFDGRGPPHDFLAVFNASSAK